jgi:hypothetical protein
MLKKRAFCIPDIFLGMLLAVAIFASGAVFESSPYDTSQKIAETQSKEEPHSEGYWSAFWDWMVHDASGFFTFALVGVGAIQIAVFLRQLRIIREGLEPARDAAAAAKLNAEAVMDAEGAQLYPVIKSHNLKDVFGHKLLILNPSNPEIAMLETPRATYCFKNYGKTPAKLFLVMDNIEFRASGSKEYEIAHAADERALEVIGAGQESAEIQCEMLGHFRWNEGHAVLNDQGELILTGNVFFRDFFDRQFICEWRCTGSRRGFKLVSHGQRLDPNAKKKMS